MSAPFSFQSRSGELGTFAVTTVVALVLACWVSHLGASLKTTVPNGIVALELAWSAPRADAILRCWDTEQRAAAIRQTYWDFLFLIAYPLAFSFSCAVVSHHVRSPLSDIGVALAWIVLLAGVFDAAENVCLLRMLHVGARGWLSQGATVCAAIKFALLASVVGFWTLAALQRVIDAIKFVRGGGSV